ncbi:MAG TPA: hypothetical protein DIW66_04645 [Serratia liquefaciens]|nr:hypothetical protein [Serratia liquefaciens]
MTVTSSCAASVILVFGESDLTHSDLLRGHNQYVGRSLKVNGSDYRDAYSRPVRRWWRTMRLAIS